MRWGAWMTLAGLALALAACGDDGGSSSGEDEDDTATTGDASDDAPAGQCSDTSEVDQVYAPPGECFNNAGCESCNCLTFQDNPPLVEAQCQDDPGTGMRITATLFQFPEQTPLPNTEVAVIGAFQLGVNGIDQAVPITTVTSGADGRVDFMIDDPEDSIGIVGVVQGDGFRRTATGLGQPEGAGGYEASNAIHDLFLVPDTLLAEWSDVLSAEPELEEFLPLGDEGGVVGIARNRYTGLPMEGIVIVSLLGNESIAHLRYLNEDGSFNSSATSTTGIYILVNPNLAEQFEAELNGQVVSTRANRAGSGAPGIFSMNLTIDTDPGMNPFE